MSKPSLEKRVGPLNERAYLHTKCGSYTTVNNESLRGLCDPCQWIPATYCANCEDMAPLAEYEWAHTGETIPDYRERILAGAPALIRVFDQKIAVPLTCVLCLAGAVVAAYFTPGSGGRSRRP